MAVSLGWTFTPQKSSLQVSKRTFFRQKRLKERTSFVTVRLNELLVGYEILYKCVYLLIKRFGRKWIWRYSPTPSKRGTLQLSGTWIGCRNLELTQYRPTVELKFCLQNSVPPSSTVSTKWFGYQISCLHVKRITSWPEVNSTNLAIPNRQPCRPHRPVLSARWLLPVPMTFNSTTSPAALAMTEVWYFVCMQWFRMLNVMF